MRPFDSTDADVVGIGEIELELGLSYIELSSGDHELEVPAYVFNIGVFHETEVVLESIVSHEKFDNAGATQFIDTGLFVKHVWHHGENWVPSFATETGLWFPTEANAAGLDFETVGIFTWEPEFGAIHLNLGFAAENDPTSSQLNLRFFWGHCRRNSPSRKNFFGFLK